jgi:integrase
MRGYEGFTPASLRAALAAEGQDEPAIELFLLLWEETDMTVDEIIRLEWGDIDFENGCIYVREGR